MLLACFSMIVPAVFLVSCLNRSPGQSGYLYAAEFLVIYGLLVGFLFLCRSKLISVKSEKRRGRSIAICILVAVLMIGYGASFFYHQSSAFVGKTPVTITFTNTGSTLESKASEVWLRCYQSGNLLSAQRLLESDEQTQWYEKDGYLVSTREGDALSLTFSSPHFPSFEFQKHPYCGTVSVSYPGNAYQIELYSDVGSTYTLSPRNSQPMEYSVPAFAVLAILLAVSGTALYRFMILYEIGGWRLLYLMCFIPAVAIAWIDNELNAVYSLILLVSILIVFFCEQIWKSEHSKIYLRGFNLFLASLATMYAAFALVGADLMLRTQRMDLSPNTLFYFCLVVAIIFPLCFACIYGIGALRNIINCRMILSDSSGVRLRWGMFALMSGLLILISLPYYPGFMSPDGVSHWLEAIGQEAIYDAHPVPFILFVRLMAGIYNSPYVFVITQIILFSYVISGFLQMLFQRGLPLPAVILMGIASAILPSNYMSLMLLSKNPISGLLNLWLMQLLIRFAIQPRECVKKWSWLTAVVLVGCCVINARKNNIVILPILAICFLIITVRRYTVMKGRLILSVMLIIALNASMNYLIEKNVPFMHSSNKIIALLTPYEAMASMDVEIPEGIRNELEEYVCTEDLGKHYNRFNSDVFSWSDVRFKTERLGDMHLVGLYLKALATYPDIVIKDRLDGIESYWSIFPSKAEGAYNVPFVVGIHSLFPKEMLPASMSEVYPDENDCYVNPCSLQKPITNFAYWTFENVSINIFIWRSGLSLVLLLLCQVYLVANKQWLFLSASLPTLAILGTVFLAVGWQIFVYQYFFPIAARWFIICTLFLMPEQKQPLSKIQEA